MQIQTIKEQNYRYLIIISYIIATIANSLPVSTFVSLSSTVQKLFNLGLVQLSLNTLIFPIAHTIFAFPCNWIINKKGIKISFYISAVLVVGGMWMRIFLESSSSVCLFGSLLSAIGGIFIFNAPSRIANTWFRSEIVPSITFFGVLTNLISIALSLSLPGIFINKYSNKTDVINFFKAQAIFATFCFLILIIIIKQKPKYPPSKSAAFSSKLSNDKYINTIRSIFKNKEYLKLSISMAFSYGVSIAFSTVLEPILVNIGYKYSSQAISVIGLSGIILGIISNILYSTFLKNIKKYKNVLISACFSYFIGLTIWVFGLLQILQEWWQLVLISSLFCFNHFALPSIFVLFSTQVAFPLDQASTAGYMTAISQTFGFLIGLIYANMLERDRSIGPFIFYITISCIFIAFLISLTIKQDLRKTKYEEGENEFSEIGMDNLQKKNIFQSQ